MESMSLPGIGEGNIGTYTATGGVGQPTPGGYSTHFVVTQDFVPAHPGRTRIDVAAPLLCADITTYSP